MALRTSSRCEISLNNHVINVFDEKPENAISNQIDTEIRAFLTKSETDKMLDEQTRTVEIILTDQKGSYTICLYLRKGNTRVTGKSYSEVVDTLIELCWIISKRLNPLVTETRVIPTTAFSRANFAMSAQQPSPLPDPAPSTKHDDPDEELATPKVAVQKTLEVPQEKVAVVDVVDALDKLVDLHKKGYLSDAEFSLAKTKLLQ